ncbi:hypothetical protein VHEMI10187 [[Torrubiella] hemipterigena]|uniref:Fungal N-terminal domain-containing protein n=1 Tax=[Torrubiella] hemipterigena TaxID=1531966 RepID=A0A0A1TRH5_9HYPO|nr:hypothetical protein VHEMI10187 [[Torrubiella] hemipterigena]
MAGYGVMVASIHLLSQSVFKTARTVHDLYNGSKEMEDFVREMKSLGRVLLIFQDACETALTEIPEGKLKQQLCDISTALFEDFEHVIGKISEHKKLANKFAQESGILNRLLNLLKWQRRASHIESVCITIEYLTSHANMFSNSVTMHYLVKRIKQLERGNNEVPLTLLLKIVSATEEIRREQRVANEAIKKIKSMDREVLRNVGLRSKQITAWESTSRKIQTEAEQCMDESRKYRAAAHRPEGQAQRKRSPMRRNKRPDVYFEWTSATPSSSSRSGSDQYPPSETSRRSRRSKFMPRDASAVSSRTWSSNTSSASDGTQYSERSRPTRWMPLRRPTSPTPRYAAWVRDHGHGVPVEGTPPDVLPSPDVRIISPPEGNFGSPSSPVDSSISRDPQGKDRDNETMLGLPTEVEPLRPLRTGSNSRRMRRHGSTFGPSGLFTQEDLEDRRRRKDEDDEDERSDDSSD